MPYRTVHVEGHYEVDETPFARTYKWYPAHLTFECDCGEQLTLRAQSTIATCQCGTDHSAIAQDILIQDIDDQAQLRDAITAPWRHDSKDQEDQHLRDEAAHPESSPWRYNDITSRGSDDESNVR